MRKLFFYLAIFFSVLGIAFAVLPLGTIALLPIGLALIFSFLSFKKSEENQKKIPKLLLIVSALTLLVVVGKEVFIKDEVIIDKQFDQNKIESKKDAVKELEGLE
ncbi:MAG TPA: hypothetical protein VIK55_08815 [Paludibacter sp.]